MTSPNFLGRGAACLSTLAMVAAPATLRAEEPPRVLPPPASLAERLPAAAETVTAAFNVTDVALDARGSLHGQVLTAQGQPVAGAPVVLDDGASQVTGTTGSDGAFRFDHVRGGAYRVQSAGQTHFCRAWTSGTAPPAANTGVMVVPAGATVLGQYCSSPVGCGSPVAAGFGGLREALKNPLVVGGIVAAAIAIPVALHDADNDDPAS